MRSIQAKTQIRVDPPVGVFDLCASTGLVPAQGLRHVIRERLDRRARVEAIERQPRAAIEQITFCWNHLAITTERVNLP